LRYRVNVLVTRPKSAGAPVVQETHPTSSNLIGRIEQRLRAGETITDHTRIKAGALYEANGGYLILECQDILRDPSAWEGLKRALKNREIELDDPGEPGRMVSIASLRPEPVPMSLKVILIGTPDLYYALAKNDLDFSKLFKVKADFDTEMDRSKDRIAKFLQFLSTMCSEEELRKLTPEGAGRVLEEAVRLSGNQKKLTTRLGDIADLVREANFWASKEKSRLIDAKHVKRALLEKSDREGFLESKMIEDILEHRVSIETEGEVIGQVNALTVIELGNYNFGVPLRVTCRAGSGRGELVDIERETELGGPIHTKGTLIIRGLLADRFGRDIPLGFNASICMEQTYTDVDGDSASLAECCALMSALAQVPISQAMAVTGSLDQRGQVQAVGGVNEKIEGFFRVCKARGSSKGNAVIIPASNKLDLMLNEEVVAACQAGTFEIYTVEGIEDALKLLTRRFWDKGDDALKPAIFATLKRFHDMHDKKSTRDDEDMASWKSAIGQSKKNEPSSAVPIE
jgi:lon-related putative ATP-dependent protease